MSHLTIHDHTHFPKDGVCKSCCHCGVGAVVDH